jgi:hypothetical protein
MTSVARLADREFPRHRAGRARKKERMLVAMGPRGRHLGKPIGIGQTELAAISKGHWLP